MLKPSLQKRLRARSLMVSDALMNGEDEDDDGSDIFEYLFSNPTHRRQLRRDGGMISRRRGGVEEGNRNAGSDCAGGAVSLEGGKRGRHGSGGDDESARKRQRIGSSSKEGTTGKGRPETFDLLENPVGVMHEVRCLSLSSSSSLVLLDSVLFRPLHLPSGMQTRRAVARPQPRAERGGDVGRFPRRRPFPLAYGGRIADPARRRLRRHLDEQLRYRARPPARPD